MKPARNKLSIVDGQLKTETISNFICLGKPAFDSNDSLGFNSTTNKPNKLFVNHQFL